MPKEGEGERNEHQLNTTIGIIMVLNGSKSSGTEHLRPKVSGDHEDTGYTGVCRRGQ